jgi:hypothetical protein
MILKRKRRNMSIPVRTVTSCNTQITHIIIGFNLRHTISSLLSPAREVSRPGNDSKTGSFFLVGDAITDL